MSIKNLRSGNERGKVQQKNVTNFQCDVPFNKWLYPFKKYSLSLCSKCTKTVFKTQKHPENFVNKDAFSNNRSNSNRWKPYLGCKKDDLFVRTCNPGRQFVQR